MNYFEFYDLPISFLLDEKKLKGLFFRKSRELHPDFHTLASEEKQAEILELSTYNNKAYAILSDFDARMKYILTLAEVMDEEGQAQIPQDFLIEMMDINEQLMELEFGFDSAIFEKVTQELETLENGLYQQVSPLITAYSSEKTSTEELNTIKEYYLKKRYLLRIRKNLNKFTPA